MTQLEQLSNSFIGLVEKLFTRGTSAFLIVFGRRETGKSDFLLLLAEMLYELGIIKNWASNIRIYNSPFPIKHITNLDDLRLWARTTEGKKGFLFDEFGKAMRRRSPMSSLNIQLIDDLQILRKYKLTTIAATVDEKYVDNASLGSDVLDGIFIKPNYQDPKIALYLDNLENFRKTITNIPPTSIDFDEWDVAPFKEHGITNKPAFKDHDLEVLWDWSHGKTIKDLGMHSEQINRLTRKFIKEVLERDSHLSQPSERAVMGSTSPVTEAQ